MTYMEEKPHWFEDHERSDAAFAELTGRQIRNLEDSLREMKAGDLQWRNEFKEMFQPVIDTYTTVGRLGKWGKIILGTVLLLLSIAIALRTLLKI